MMLLSESETETKTSCEAQSFGWNRIATLGQGATGEVSVWEEAKTKEKLAVKICSRRKLSHRHYTYWMREVSVMKKLRHLNVVRGFPLPEEIQLQTQSKLTPLAMEYCSGGSLREFCTHYRRGVPENELRNVLRDLCAGLRYLHRKHIVHRDIKPDNIVIQKAQRLIYKITDLGYIKILDPKKLTRSFCGTIGYAAPEILNSSHVRKYNYLVDYWSLGVTIFEVATGFRPFRDIPICGKKENAIWGRRTLRGIEYYLELPERCRFSELFGNYLNYWLRIMLHRDPAERNPDMNLSPLDGMLRFLALNEQQNLFRLTANSTQTCRATRNDYTKYQTF